MCSKEARSDQLIRKCCFIKYNRSYETTGNYTNVRLVKIQFEIHYKEPVQVSNLLIGLIRIESAVRYFNCHIFLDNPLTSSTTRLSTNIFNLYALDLFHLIN